MQQFIEKYSEEILGTLSGFDRLVFRAAPRRLCSFYRDHSREIVVAKGMEEYLWQNKIYFKDFGQYVRRISSRIKNRFLKPFQEQKLPVVFVRDPKLDKDQLARELAAKQQIDSGLVCAISTVEPSPPSNTSSPASPVACDLVTCFTSTRNTRSWDGCMPAYRPGFLSTCRWG